VVDKKTKQTIVSNYREPDATVQYLFVEKVDEQHQPLNDDQGYMSGYINLFSTGEWRNADAAHFQALLRDEIVYSVMTYEYFTNRSVDFAECKFAIVLDATHLKEAKAIDQPFFEALMSSTRRLLVAGDNFDFHAFSSHRIFTEWHGTIGST
jgi:hypothetical protein